MWLFKKKKKEEDNTSTKLETNVPAGSPFLFVVPELMFKRKVECNIEDFIEYDTFDVTQYDAAHKHLIRITSENSSEVIRLKLLKQENTIESIYSSDHSMRKQYCKESSEMEYHIRIFATTNGNFFYQQITPFSVCYHTVNKSVIDCGISEWEMKLDNDKNKMLLFNDIIGPKRMFDDSFCDFVLKPGTYNNVAELDSNLEYMRPNMTYLLQYKKVDEELFNQKFVETI